jgi:peptide/nickel transport system substrate-binding protein
MSSAGIEARVLGPLQTDVGGLSVTLKGERQRACFAALLVARGGVVSREALAQELWGDERPQSERASVQMHVSRLRRALGNGHGDGAVLLPAVNGGYALGGPVALDGDRFEAAIAAARTQPPEAAAEALSTALALWRGPAYADAGNGPLITAERRRLEDLRREARLTRARLEIALGRPGAAVADLRMLAGDDPLDETVARDLMLALADSGRVADALAQFHALRRRLVDELGIEPGRELRDLYEQLVRRERVVAVETTPAARLSAAPGASAPLPPRRRGGHVTLLAGMALAVVGVAVAAIAWPRDEPRAWPSTGAIARLDSGTGTVRAVTTVGARPVGIAVLDGETWVATAGDNALVRMRGGERERIPLAGGVDGLAAGLGALWVVDGAGGTVRRVDPATGRVVATVRVGNGPVAVTTGAGRVWVLTAGDANLVRLTPDGRVDSHVAVGSLPTAVAVARGSVWVADGSAGTVSAVDARTLAPRLTVAVGGQPRALARADGALWAANELDGTLSRIDPAGGRVVATVPIGRGVDTLAGARADLWVGDPAHGAVALVHGPTGAVVRRIPVHGAVSALAAEGGHAWAVTLPPASAHVGGTLVIAGSHLPRTLHAGDPAADYTSDADALHAATNDGLLTYRRVPGAPGAATVPDLAAAPPTVSRGGRVWTFRLRRGIAFSTGEPVRPADVRATMLRLYRMHPPALDEYVPLGLAGERACLRRARGRTCNQTLGVRADDDAGTVTMRVTDSGRALQLALAAPLFSILPAGTPARPLTKPPFPATGPYHVTLARPGRVVLTRNPRYREWSADAQPAGYPDRIVWLNQLPLAAARAALDDHRADVLFSELDAATIRDAVRFAPGRTVAMSAPPSVEFLGFQTQRRPFADSRVRQAAVLSVDRAKLARALGPPLAMGVACGLLPQGLPGARPPCPGDEGTATGLVRARRLVARAGARGRRATLLVPAGEPGVRRALELLAEGLRRTGLRARLVTGPHDHFAYFDRVLEGRADAFWAHWYAQSPDPDEFLTGLLGCRATPGAVHFTGWCDATYDRLTAQARAVAPSDAAAAATLWARADRRATTAAPLIPFGNGRLVTAVSPRTGNILTHPRYGILLDQLWVR